MQALRQSEKSTYRTVLRCIYCGREYPISGRGEEERLGNRLACPNPSCIAKHKWIYGSLDVEYDYESFRDQVNFRSILDSNSKSMWRYSNLLPVTIPVTLGEGSTPIVRSKRLASDLEIDDLILKYEGTNPTGSFKDRESAVGISRALEIRARGVTCISSGNAAASLAAYAAHAGLDCIVFTPTGASLEKQKIIEYTGARLITVDGIFEDVWELVNRGPSRDPSISEKLYASYYNCNPALNPYRSEGDKTTAFEIYSDLQKVPDWVVVPIGNGSNLSGIWKGFKELQNLGITTSLPRMLGVQIYDADPVARAWKDGRDQSIPIENPADSIAEGIVAKDSYDAPKALRALKESNGAVASVTDDETLDKLFLCTRKEGIFVEPTSATALAATQQMRQDGLLSKSDLVVVVLTGAGFKTIEAMVKGNVRDKALDLYRSVNALLR